MENFDLSVKRRDGYMQVLLSGTPSVGHILSLLHVLGVESESWPHPRIVMDVLGVSTPLSTKDEFEIGLQMSASFRHLERVAILVPRGRVTRVSERAAVRNGADVRVFDLESAAVAWMASTPA